MSSTLRIKRVYEPFAAADGFRILVDRIWPRGVGKADAHVDLWLKEVAPSTDLRKWFGHRPERWEAFRRRYLAELEDAAALDTIRDVLRSGPVTLLYGAKDEVHNQAQVLGELLCGSTAGKTD